MTDVIPTCDDVEQRAACRGDVILVSLDRTGVSF
jgi:hypothetical protein